MKENPSVLKACFPTAPPYLIFHKRGINIYSGVTRGFLNHGSLTGAIPAKPLGPLNLLISRYDIRRTLCNGGRNRASALSLPDVLDGWRTLIRPAAQGHGRPHGVVPFQPTLRHGRSLWRTEKGHVRSNPGNATPRPLEKKTLWKSSHCWRLSLNVNRRNGGTFYNPSNGSEVQSK